MYDYDDVPAKASPNREGGPRLDDDGIPHTREDLLRKRGYTGDEVMPPHLRPQGVKR